jgi:hypothetical protein
VCHAVQHVIGFYMTLCDWCFARSAAREQARAAIRRDRQKAKPSVRFGDESGGPVFQVFAPPYPGKFATDSSQTATFSSPDNKSANDSFASEDSPGLSLSVVKDCRTLAIPHQHVPSAPVKQPLSLPPDSHRTNLSATVFSQLEVRTND